ncbi:PREDICTED: uncharacterized protein LOC106747215 [Dinoponera quadriceps]|uniref:Uncharacterized protein LOC106747215 n=1 Tax=Dinoponera quadriceps TaxID=609295 RepID=A0A6P3XPV7_DINQU|nr:PREDICTED: uncharacterized protein LOC106747215 [Dinoponera quadriceps]
MQLVSSLVIEQFLQTLPANQASLNHGAVSSSSAFTPSSYFVRTSPVIAVRNIARLGAEPAILVRPASQIARLGAEPAILIGNAHLHVAARLGAELAIVSIT